MKKNIDLEKLYDLNPKSEIEIDEKLAEDLNVLVEELGLSDKLRFTKTEKEEENEFCWNLLSFPSEKKELMEINYDLIKENPILEGVKYSNTIEYIDLDQLMEISDSINFFETPDNEEFIELALSIETFGIVNPLLVKKDETTGKYTVVTGRNRLFVLRGLWDKSNDEKYFKIPCIVLDDSINDAMIQGIIIASNSTYRKVSRETLMKSIFLLNEIYKSSKMHRNTTKITNAIAKSVGVTRTTVKNYLDLKNLSPLAMDLVANKYMNLSVGKTLAMTDHETQDLIIRALKNDINDLRKVRSLMEGPKAKVYDKEKGCSVPETWNMKINSTKGMIPLYTYITLKVSCGDVEGTLKNINVLRKEYALKYLAKRKNGLNRYFKVSLNDNHIEQYIKKGFVNQETVDKIRSGEFKEIIKLA